MVLEDVLEDYWCSFRDGSPASEAVGAYVQRRGERERRKLAYHHMSTTEASISNGFALVELSRAWLAQGPIAKLDFSARTATSRRKQ